MSFRKKNAAHPRKGLCPGKLHHKCAAVELHNSEVLNNALVRAIPDLIFTNTRDGEYLDVHVNDPSLLFVPPELFIHRMSKDVLPQPLADQFATSFAKALDTGVVQEIHYSLPLREGVRYFEARVAPCTEDTVISIVRDVTERKQSEEEQHRLLERMHQVQRLEALGVLVAGVSHNLNNVLSAIMAAAELQEMRTSDPKDLETYRIINTACLRGRDVVRSLTHFARSTLVVQVPIDLHALLQEVKALLVNVTLNRLKIVEEFYPEPLWIMGDPGSLNHAIMNLCINSMDAMPHGGTVTFKTNYADPPGVVALEVVDTGEGMDPEVLSRAIEPFYTTKAVGKGTGLGLSMTHGVIKAHQGTMSISSSPGLGTIIELSIPRIPAPVPTQASIHQTMVMESLDILLVDDDYDVRYLVSRMLTRAGMRVNSALCGEDALDLLRTGPLPDLIILDQNMPGMDGAQTLDQIRRVHPTLLVLISSGQPDIDEWECFKQPHTAVINKPFEIKELLEAVKKLVN